MRLFHSRRHGCSVWGRAFVGALVLAAAVLTARSASAYSVLTHEGMVDAMWQSEIAPLLQQRFGPLTSKQLAEARAYAYGGSLIQDLGYYPFGSPLFTDLMHYVRAGDFVESLLEGATNANEYAFALGALAHYNSDCAGHPLAVNRVVPMMYPKVRAKVGPDALYVDSPARHVMVEFAFDVLQVARGAYVGTGVSRSHRLRGREAAAGAKPCARPTVSSSATCCRMSISPSARIDGPSAPRFPELTRIAWRDKRDDIEKATPGSRRRSSCSCCRQPTTNRQFGKNYRKPGLFSRILAFVLKILPKVGPLRPLAFEPLTPEADTLFAESVAASRVRYRATLRSLRSGPLPPAKYRFRHRTAAGARRESPRRRDLCRPAASACRPRVCQCATGAASRTEHVFRACLAGKGISVTFADERIERDLRAMNSDALSRSASADRRHAGSP